jgi:hypothetical protein
MPNTSRKLVHVLIGKSIVETLLIGALAVFTFITVFPPYFHGWAEVTDTGIAGWAVNNSEPSQRVQVQLFINGQFVAASVAELARPDVSAAGWASDPRHGYVFPVPKLPVGRHEARIYALHNSGEGNRKSLQLLGDPVVFSIEPEGKVVKVSENK